MHKQIRTTPRELSAAVSHESSPISIAPSPPPGITTKPLEQKHKGGRSRKHNNDMPASTEAESKALDIPEPTSNSIIEKDNNKEETPVAKKVGIAKYITVGALFVGAAAYEIGYTLLSGRSFFLGTINQAGEVVGSVDKFKNFFEKNPVGKAIENTLSFLGSKPIKRIFRIATMTTALVAVDVATTGGALTAAAIAVSCMGIVVNSINEYRAQKKIKDNIGESKEIEALRNELTIQKNRLTKKGVSPEIKKAMAEFVLGEQIHTPCPDAKPKNLGFFSRLKESVKATIPKYYHYGIRSLGENLLETVGSLASGDIREFGALVSMGAYRDVNFKYNHDLLNEKLDEAITADKTQIGNLFGLDAPYHYKNKTDIELAMKKQKLLVQIIEDDPSLLNARPAVLKERLHDKFINVIENEKNELASKRSKMSVLDKTQEFFSNVAKSKFVSPVLGYLGTWVPRKLYNPETEIKALHARRFDFNTKIDKLTKPRHVVSREIEPGTQTSKAYTQEQTHVTSEHSSVKADRARKRIAVVHDEDKKHHHKSSHSTLYKHHKPSKKAISHSQRTP